MLQNAYLLAKIGADTAENEQHFAEILPIGRRVDDVGEASSLPRRSWPSRPRLHGRRARTPDPVRRTRSLVQMTIDDESNGVDRFFVDRYLGRGARPCVERFGRRGTEPNGLFRSEFGQNSFKIQEFSLKQSKKIQKFQHFLKHRRNSDNISSKSEQKSVKRIQK